MGSQIDPRVSVDDDEGIVIIQHLDEIDYLATDDVPDEDDEGE